MQLRELVMENLNDQSQPQLLVVDDEEDILEAIGDLFEDDYIIHTARNADEGLKYLNNGDDIAVILCDQRMPGMNGTAFLNIARQRVNATRMLITGYSDLDDVIGAVNDSNIYAYVSKPYSPAELQILVARAVEHYHLITQLERDGNVFQSLMKHIPGTLLIEDLDGRVLGASRTVAEFFELDKPEELQGKRLEDLAQEDYLDKIIERKNELVAQVRRTGEAVSNDIASISDPRNPDMKWYARSVVPIFDRHGRIDGTIMIGRDITDMITAREEAEDMARFAIENPAPVMRFDAEGRLLTANPAAKNLIKEQKQNLQSAEEWSGVVKEAIKSGNISVKEINLGGKILEFFYAPNPEKEYVNVYGNDVTNERKMQEQMQISQKLEAVGQLTSGIAHDFNNRLTVILGNLQLLERNLLHDGKNRPLIESAIKATNAGAELTRSLLAYSRRQVLDPEPVCINDVVNEIHPVISRTLPEKIVIRLELEDAPSPVMIDPHKMQDVLINLSINAKDAMPEGGSLVIRTFSVKFTDEDCQHYAYLQPGSYTAVMISDTGTGMDEVTRQRVFEPFFTTKEVGRGTGLGLSMVYGFVKQSNGFIHVYSEVDYGTSIKIYLPAIDAPPVTFAAKVDAVEPGPENEEINTLRVLVVEDEIEVRQVVMAMLESLGHESVEAGSGPEALEILEQDSDIHLVFTDLVMPGGMSGIELVHKVRERFPGVKVLFTSGYTDHEALENEMGQSGTTWLRKPYTRQALEESIQQAFS